MQLLVNNIIQRRENLHHLQHFQAMFKELVFVFVAN